ncbi:NADP-dependent oxidoreductase [Streptomyces sp. VRA16 Mangrove soil]|uniref:MDR family NADP-dependent oxidoreductase n=1 Tax=Streptomyces sp. VRA16 Mangrove soil TaxID=2817434 RepID=UPI001A9D42FD|nr:NADP-dependent oxidoreductase [Streptomyces sp. VRA16 Mangrove soil]MBO1329900.1 NADP-dependent oxidoreductase [Streptomyces sp. VRA16 Mangrove soil]
MPVSPAGREIRLAVNPTGLPAPEHFTVAEAPVPHPASGQLLLRNRHFLVFPGLRTLISAEAKDFPFPPLKPGEPLFGPALGEVVATGPDGTDVPAGTLVTHMQGWREYAVVDADAVRAVPAGHPDPVALLSTASAAYGALTRLAALRPGETVLVTGAAGGVGSLAGQIARLLGAARVVGTTRSPGKAARLREELGYDAVVVPGDDLVGALAGAAPDGYDVIVDNVGGAQLTAAVELTRPGARIAVVGALSGQFDPALPGGTSPAVIDTFALVKRSVSLLGYQTVDHPGVEEEWRERFDGWLRSGEIVFPYTVVRGMEHAPSALQELQQGRHFGTLVVEV